MTLTQDQVLDVMAWADGELEGADAARVEALVASNAEAQELVRSFDALGDFVRTSHHREQIAAVGVADAVMAKTKPNDIERARLKRAQKGRVVLIAATLAAIAAGVLVYARTQPVALPNAHAPSANPAPLALSEGVQVDQVDGQDNGVSVFYVPAEDPVPSDPDQAPKTPNTTVVWIDDTPQSP